MAGDLTRAMLGTRSRLLGVVGSLVLLVLVVPIVLLVLGLVIPAVISAAIGVAGFVLVVMALMPGRRRW